MPISSTSRKAGPFFGNGAATTFTFNFKIFEPSELRVVRFSSTLGVDLDLVAGVDYSITLNPDQDEAPGGEVVLAVAPAIGDRVVLLSDVPDTQPVDLTNQGGFYPDLLNGGLDRSTIQVQQLREELGRAIKLPPTAEDGEYVLPLPQGNQLLAWGQDGKTITNLDPGELISVVTYGNTKADVFEGDGTSTAFTLSASPGSVNNLAISIDGVVQVPEIDYAWGGGKSLVFNVAPPAGTRIFVRYQEALDEGTDVSGKANRGGDNITSAPGWRDALGLGDAATKDIGSGAGTVAAGDDARIAAVDSKQDRVSRLPQAYGAVGDGVANDVTALLATMAAAGVDGLVDGKKLRYGVDGNALLVPSGVTIKGVSLNRISGTAQAIRMDGAGATLEGMSIDNKASVGNRAGHGVRATADDLTIRNVEVKDFGSMDGIGGGTGVIVSNFGGAFRPQRPSLDGLHVKGNLSSQITVGWLFDNTDFGSARNILAENIVGSSGIGYAHELKNGSRYNSLNQLRTNFAEVGLAYGQEGAAIGDGASYNVATNVVSNAVDRGFVAGKGIGNVSVGAVSRADGRPGQAAQFYAIELNDQQREVHAAHAAHGASTGDRGVLLSGASTKNFVQVASHVADTTLIRITDTSRDNVIEVLHPGDKTSILGAVNDTSGAPTHGAGTNVVYSHATGEYLGTLSGRFRWNLGNPGASFNTGHRFQMARDGNVILAMGTPGSVGAAAGITHAAPGVDIAAQFVHAFGAATADHTWSMTVAGANRYVWSASAFRPSVNNSVALGSGSQRFTEVFAVNGTINTSDEREKQDIGAIPDEWLDAWGDVEWSRFKWKDAVAEKGEAARWHVGLIAQRVRDAFAARGLNAFEIGLLCYDEWDAEEAVVSEETDEETGETIRTEVAPARQAGDSYGVRYTEALALEAAWVRRELTRLAGLGRP